MRKRRPLKQSEWEEIGRCYREALATFERVGSAILHFEPVRIYDRWLKVSNILEALRPDLEEEVRSYLGPDYPATELFQPKGGTEGPERISYGWRNPTSLGKRILTREEWVLVGDDVKLLRASLWRARGILELWATRPKCRPWTILIGKIDNLKGRFDSTLAKQHHDWQEFARVFYGKSSEANPKLLESLEKSTAP